MLRGPQKLLEMTALLKTLVLSGSPNEVPFYLVGQPYWGETRPSEIELLRPTSKNASGTSANVRVMKEQRYLSCVQSTAIDTERCLHTREKSLEFENFQLRIDCIPDICSQESYITR